MLTLLLVALAAYLLGSIPFPVLVSKVARGIDLREHGSGNMGAMNAARVLGKRWFPVVFGLDFLKGALSAYVAMRLLPGAIGISPLLAAAIGGVVAVVGHCFPIFAGFRGGLGLAASAGALALISPWLLAGAGAAILLYWWLTKNMYVGTALAALSAPFIAWPLIGPAPAAVVAFWGLLVFYLHWEDVKAWWAQRSL